MDGRPGGSQAEVREMAEGLPERAVRADPVNGHRCGGREQSRGEGEGLVFVVDWIG